MNLLFGEQTVVLCTKSSTQTLDLFWVIACRAFPALFLFRCFIWGH